MSAADERLQYLPQPNADPTGHLNKYFPRIAIAVVIIALVGLAVAPIALLYELNRMRAHTAATSQRALSNVAALRLVFAYEVEEHQAFALQHLPASAQQYHTLRTREKRTLAALGKLANPTNSRIVKQVDALRALTERWHRLPDRYLTGAVSDAAFRTAIPSIHAQRDSVLDALDTLSDLLNQFRTRDIAQGGQLIQRQRVLSLVVGNLISNAVKYTTYGTVTVHVARSGLQPDGNVRYASIEVADTGSGIATDQQHLLFQEFVRLDPKVARGAGIGLAISQRVARALDGEITVTSQVGRGSRFTLWLPLAKESETQVEDMSEQRVLVEV